MTARRTYARPTPPRTNGAEAVAVPCAGRWFVYDVLVDQTSGAVFRAALTEARSICATCDLFAECMTANRGEPWAEAVITGKSLQQRVKAGEYTPPPRKYVTSRDQRLADLTAFAEAGHTAESAAARLGISRDSLWSWCRKNGHRDLWARLTREVAA